jgi:hypothetical protein
MKRAFIFFVSSLLGSMLFSETVWAAIIHLKSGKTITGKVIERKADSIKVETLGVQLTYFSDEIDRIEEDPQETAQPEKTTKENDQGEKTSEYPLLKEDIAVVAEQKISTVESSPGVSLATPQEAYKAYLNALESGDWQVIKKYVAKENIVTMEAGGNVAEAVVMLKDLRVRDLEIIDTILTDDRATLVAYGTTLFGSAEGIVEMIMEDGEWKVDKTNWEGEEKVQNSSQMATPQDMTSEKKSTATIPVTPAPEAPKENASPEQ